MENFIHPGRTKPRRCSEPRQSGSKFFSRSFCNWSALAKQIIYRNKMFKYGSLAKAGYLGVLPAYPNCCWLLEASQEWFQKLLGWQEATRLHATLCQLHGLELGRARSKSVLQWLMVEAKCNRKDLKRCLPWQKVYSKLDICANSGCHICLSISIDWHIGHTVANQAYNTKFV